jgi:hypothetical protein
MRCLLLLRPLFHWQASFSHTSSPLVTQICHNFEPNATLYNFVDNPSTDTGREGLSGFSQWLIETSENRYLGGVKK